MTEPELVQEIVNTFAEIAAVHKEFQEVHKAAEDMMLKSAMEFGFAQQPSSEVWDSAKQYVSDIQRLTKKRGELLDKSLKLTLQGYLEFG